MVTPALDGNLRLFDVPEATMSAIESRHPGWTAFGDTALGHVLLERAGSTAVYDLEDDSLIETGLARDELIAAIHADPQELIQQEQFTALCETFGPPTVDAYFGLIVPAKLGGAFELGNVQVIGRAENVAEMLSLHAQIRGLRPGTRVNQVRLREDPKTGQR